MGFNLNISSFYLLSVRCGMFCLIKKLLRLFLQPQIGKHLLRNWLSTQLVHGNARDDVLRWMTSQLSAFFFTLSTLYEASMREAEQSPHLCFLNKSTSLYFRLVELNDKHKVIRPNRCIYEIVNIAEPKNKKIHYMEVLLLNNNQSVMYYVYIIIAWWLNILG